ncbi:MAG: DUF2868 domain-containing protein, partial [Psychrobacter sp.]
APTPIAPKATVSAGKKLVALLEYPTEQDSWWQSGFDNTLEGDVENFGILDDRDDMARLKTYLDNHPVQVLLGIHNRALPDRGTLRKLDQIASHAKEGLIVKLLNDTGLTVDASDLHTSESQQVENQGLRYQQWQTALSAREIGLVDTDA